MVCRQTPPESRESNSIPVTRVIISHYFVLSYLHNGNTKQSYRTQTVQTFKITVPYLFLIPYWFAHVHVKIN